MGLNKKTVLGLALIIMVITFVQINANKRENDLLNSAYENVKAGYGDFYIPSISIEPSTLEAIYGVSFEAVESYFGESAMMSTYPDVFIGVKAHKGKAKEIGEALNAYREHLLVRFKDSASGLAKVNASRVFIYGNYVFYMVLGQPTDIMITSEASAEHILSAEASAAIGFEKLNSVFVGQ